LTKPLEFEAAFAGKRVLVTGHTGFTGSWACLWLRRIGAEVIGYALSPDTSPSMFTALQLDKDVTSIEGDIRDPQRLKDAVQRYKPDCVLHLAAQALVRKSYREPLETFETNAQGTANLLEAVRASDSVSTVVCVTTDKVYRNLEWDWPYRENDELGGHDPYSASKAAAEMIIESYAHCLCDSGKGPAIAVARGGNIVGGGDWAEDRLIPDFVRAVTGSGKLTIRYPEAVRPWQHVLALVQGYLQLLSALFTDGRKFARAWNFGPSEERWYSVRDVLELLSGSWKRPELEYMDQPLPEAHNLSLDSGLARRVLGWNPAWDTSQTIERTAEWYREYYANPGTIRSITERQLEDWRINIGRKPVSP
jgi:CDP-glucose 4,6-dehydratase